MNTKEIVASLDAEIARLIQVRAAIADYAIYNRKKSRARSYKAGKPERSMSAAGRARIAAAQRKRWAKQKKVTVTKLPPREAPAKRIARPLVKEKTALTGNIPDRPVAAPKPKS